MDLYWDDYRVTYTTYKAQREAAANEWNRFKYSVDSQDKLAVLRAYIVAVNRELTYHANYWNDAWGAMDPGHTQWLDRLATMRSELEHEEAILSHRIDTERYEMVDECVPGTSGFGNATGHGEL